MGTLDTVITLRLDTDIAAWLDERAVALGHAGQRGQGGGGRSAAIRHDLAWFRANLAADLRTANLTEHEALAILDAMNGWAWYVPGDTMTQANLQSALLLQIADSIALELLAEKWQLDGPAFLDKLAALSPGQCYAILDAGRAAWALTTGDMRERVHAVGLVR